MKSKYGIFVVILVSFLMVIGAAGVYADKAEVDMLNNKVEDITESIAFLDAHHIDTSMLKEKFKEILKTKKQYLASLNTKGSSHDAAVLKQMVDLRIEALENELKKQTESVNRLDLLFKVMIFFGTFIGIISAIYFVVMYNKRK